MSGEHPVLAEHPAYVAWEQEGESLRRARVSFAEQAMAARRRREQVTAEHREQVVDAARKGLPIPAKPEVPDVSHLDAARQVLERDEQTHHRRRTAVLAEVATSEGAKWLCGT